MKSVNVTLDAGWNTEEWKIKRLFDSSYKCDLHENGDMAISVRICSSDPRLGIDGTHGFPVDGLTLHCVIPERYRSSGDFAIPLPHFSVVECSDMTRSLPAGFERTFLTVLNSNISVLSINDCPLFTTLKRCDRLIFDIWHRFILSMFSDPIVVPAPFGTSKVNSIVSLPFLLIVSHFVCDLCCLKCHRFIANVSLMSGVEWTHVCETCTRPLILVELACNIFGADCAIAKIHTISGWTQKSKDDFVYLNTLRPHIIVLEEFSYHLKTLVKLPKLVYPTIPQTQTPNVPRIYKIGNPLPSNGACKHYKKSFRWMQYPCCGEWFACNQCHEKCQEKNTCETMMCGFCSVQQPINNVCNACHKELTPGWTASQRISSEPKPRFRRKKR